MISMLLRFHDVWIYPRDTPDMANPSCPVFSSSEISTPLRHHAVTYDRCALLASYRICIPFVITSMLPKIIESERITLMRAPPSTRRTS